MLRFSLALMIAVVSLSSRPAPVKAETLYERKQAAENTYQQAVANGVAESTAKAVELEDEVQCELRH